MECYSRMGLLGRESNRVFGVFCQFEWDGSWNDAVDGGTNNADETEGEESSFEHFVRPGKSD